MLANTGSDFSQPFFVGFGSQDSIKSVPSAFQLTAEDDALSLSWDNDMLLDDAENDGGKGEIESVHDGDKSDFEMQMGQHSPADTPSFSSSSVWASAEQEATALKLLRSYLGVADAQFRKGQAEIIAAALKAKGPEEPVLGILKTAQGKTMVMAITNKMTLTPVLEKRRRAIERNPMQHQPRPCGFMISPSVALMKEMSTEWAVKHPGTKAVYVGGEAVDKTEEEAAVRDESVDYFLMAPEKLDAFLGKWSEYLVPEIVFLDEVHEAVQKYRSKYEKVLPLLLQTYPTTDFTVVGLTATCAPHNTGLIVGLLLNDGSAFEREPGGGGAAPVSVHARGTETGASLGNRQCSKV